MAVDKAAFIANAKKVAELFNLNTDEMTDAQIVSTVIGANITDEELANLTEERAKFVYKLVPTGAFVNVDALETSEEPEAGDADDNDDNPGDNTGDDNGDADDNTGDDNDDDVTGYDVTGDEPTGDEPTGDDDVTVDGDDDEVTGDEQIKDPEAVSEATVEE